MSYSIWLVPQEKHVQDYLSETLKELAEKYGGPVFEPHMTIAGDVELSLEEVKEKVEKLAQSMSPISLSTGQLSYSTTYYQCVFVRVLANPQLMRAYVGSQELFSQNVGVFMPHISLFYGDFDFEKRSEIVASMSFEQQIFSVNKLIITPGGEHPPEKWEHLVEVEF